jgi:hypothetical protein
MISYPESDGNIAESLMVLSSFDSHTHNVSGLCSFNKVDKSACLLSALQCENCDFWCHIKCVKVSISQYEKLKGSSATWVWGDVYM